jgi:isochorismate hydrolase
MPADAELPTNIARWTADPARAVLLIHDMQRYFVAPFPRGLSPRRELDHNIGLLRHRCTELGIPVAYTAQPGGMTEQQRGLLEDFWGPGMRADPEDRRIVAPIRPAEHDWVFTKWRYSAFFRSNLLGRMREGSRDQLVICGVYAHLGVLMTAVEAFSNDIETFLVADAIADFSANYHRLAVEYAAQRCAVVATTGTVLNQLTAAAERLVEVERSDVS